MSVGSETLINATAPGLKPFGRTLKQNGFKLTRDRTTTLQINTGLLCNQQCKHCHLEAGPERQELMDGKTVDDIADFAKRCRFDILDITGGAPEMNPHLADLISKTAPHVARVMLRSNLTATAPAKWDSLTRLLREHNVIINASLPSANKGQTESQRGPGVFDRSVATLQKLNEVGYGMEGSGLELNLVTNPTGAFLPVSQASLEEKFRADIQRKWDIVFNSLYTFTNVPLGRFRKWLIDSGNYEKYMMKLSDSFNPCSLEGLMCRTLVSVDWEGHMYDCDFNLAHSLPMGGRKIHVSELEKEPQPGAPIAISDHCYSCAAGSGFT